MEPTCDMISNLPKDVREKVLAYLPTKEAGRTSVLSSDWRHTWKSIPDLVIHFDKNVESAKTIKLVDEILALHDGPIRKFELLTRVDDRVNCTNALDRWLKHLLRNGIKELGLRFMGPFLEIPSSFLSCSSLNFLSLDTCCVKLPSEFQGFKFMHTLELAVCVSDDDFEKLISCPVLESLTILSGSIIYGYPRINAPNLKKLYIGGWLHMFNRLTALNVIDLNKFFSDVSNLEILELRDQFMDELIDAQLDAGKFLLINLKDLWLEFKYFEENMVKFIQPLFHNTPNLQVLRLKINWLSEDQNFWNSMNVQDFSLQSLKVMNLHGLCCKDNILPFLKFLFRSASKLRKVMIINYRHVCWGNREMCLKQKLYSLRISPDVQINFEKNRCADLIT